jgi:hypothetical protein
MAVPEATLIITYQAGGPVQVTGPIENKVLCYGMLEAARDLIKDFKPSQIIQPTGLHIVPEKGVR